MRAAAADRKVGGCRFLACLATQVANTLKNMIWE